MHQRNGIRNGNFLYKGYREHDFKGQDQKLTAVFQGVFWRP